MTMSDGLRGAWPEFDARAVLFTVHRRFFQIAGITISVESDLDFATVKFPEALETFAVEAPGEDSVTLRHHFDMPDLQGQDLGKEFYRRAPWAISHLNGNWFYRGILSEASDEELHRFAVFTADHRHATIYSPPREVEVVRTVGWQSLSLFPTDQI
jgi:hypothetical protein